jgi:hypothetical protein
MSWLAEFAALVKSWATWGVKRAARPQAGLAERVLAEMQWKQAANPAAVLFEVEPLARLVGVTASELLPALKQLEREGRVFRDARTGRYSLMRTPWAGC